MYVRVTTVTRDKVMYVRVTTVTRDNRDVTRDNRDDVIQGGEKCLL